ncbi:MAG: hypothetical protein ACD_75C02147G0001, partial [uncultured bacterium]
MTSAPTVLLIRLALSTGQSLVPQSWVGQASSQVIL